MTRRQFARLIGLLTAGAGITGFSLLHGQERHLRIGVSKETLAGANVNDARAAYKVWGQELKVALGLTETELLPDVFIPSDELVQMIRENQIDCFVLTAWEYAKVADLLDSDWMLVEDVVADGIEYVLIVHNASSYQKIDDLRGKAFVMQHHRDTVLLRAWLALQLAKIEPSGRDVFFSSEQSSVSLTQVVLPVFFKHTDVGGLTRPAYNVAVELNPQLGKELRVLAVSPKVIPSAFFFRRGIQAENREHLKDALVKLKSFAAGQQVLELYQAKGFTARRGSQMKDTLALIRQYERLGSSQPASSSKRNI